jgi:nucleotide-binding universal stress UspA family protein
MPGIVVGVDHSDHALDALRWALAEAQHRGCGVRVVHAWEPHYVYEDCRGDTAMALGEEDARRAQRLPEELLDEALGDRARPAGLETMTCRGRPGRVLVELSADADLVVIGALGRGAVRHLLTGSVARRIVNHALCPVTVVPSDTATARREAVTGVEARPSESGVGQG